jgi:ATP-dependent DNA helicase PIF1
MMRRQVNSRSSYFVKKRPGQQTLDPQDLQEAFAADTPEAQALLNSIVRYSGSLQGTRPY